MVYQCQRCGEPFGGPIAKQKAIELCGGVNPPPFDDELKAGWENKRKEAYAAIHNDDNEEFWAAYEEYLAGPEWRQKREKVLARAGGLCEGCGTNPATQVHHRSYEHVGAEFLFELVAICESCHDRLHKSDEAL